MAPNLQKKKQPKNVKKQWRTTSRLLLGLQRQTAEAEPIQTAKRKFSSLDALRF